TSPGPDARNSDADRYARPDNVRTVSAACQRRRYNHWKNCQSIVRYPAQVGLFFATASLPGWRYWQAEPAAQSRFYSFFTSVEYQSSHRHFAPVAVTGDPLKRSPASLLRSALRGSRHRDRDGLW